MPLSLLSARFFTLRGELCALPLPIISFQVILSCHGPVHARVSYCVALSEYDAGTIAVLKTVRMRETRAPLSEGSEFAEAI